MRQYLHQGYKPLFSGTTDAKAASAGIDRLNRFGWYNLLYTAADGKLQHYDEIKAMPALSVFQFLMRKKEEQQFENRLHEEAMKRNRAK